MAAPAIAVVAKKAIQIVLTDKKLRKGFFMILGIILVIIIMPIVAVLGIFMGGFTIDMDRPRELLEQNISQATDQWDDVQTTLINNGHDVMTLREAEVLYAYVLYRYVHLDNFVSLFTGCFAAEQTDEQLISNVNAAFGTNIATQEFTDIMASIRSTYIDTSHYTDPLVKNSTDLVLWCQNASATGWGYVWGTYGTVLTETFYESKKAQYPNEVGGQEEFIKEHCVPSMIIKLRQGVGRLIRTETDTGVVSILDPRASRVDYHKAIVAALGKYPIIQSVDDIKEFIMSVKDADYYE